MSPLIHLTQAGLKQLLLNRLHLILFMLMLVLCLWSVQGGIVEYQDRLAEGREFRQMEVSIFKKIPDYAKYSIYGVQVFFQPSANSIFCHYGPGTNNYYGKVNSIFDLKIYSNAKNLGLFQNDYPLPLRFPFLVLLLGGLAALTLGRQAMGPVEYLRSLASRVTVPVLYVATMVAHIVFISLAYLLLLGTNLLLAGLQGIYFKSAELFGLLHSLIVTLILLAFFFFVGCLVGLIVRHKWAAHSVLIILWVGLVVFIPLGLHFLNSGTDYTPSSSRLSNEKIAILSDFEKRAERESGKLKDNNIENARKIIEEYYKDEFNQLMALEQNNRDILMRGAEMKERIDSITPVTFYLSNCSEAGGYGPRSFIAFYDYLIHMQRRFVRFWFDRVYYHNPKEMVCFVQAQENLFTGMARGPGNFHIGVILNLIYVVALAVVTYLVFFKVLFKLSDREEALCKQPAPTLDFFTTAVFLVQGPSFKKVLFNTLLDRGGYGDEKLKRIRGDVFYLCPPVGLPGYLRVKDYLSLFAPLLGIGKRAFIDPGSQVHINTSTTLGQLSREEKFNLSLSLLVPAANRVYLLDSAAAGLPLECSVVLKDRLDKISVSGGLPIYLTPTFRADGKKAEMKIPFHEGSAWLYMVEESRITLKWQSETTPGA